jgi:transposase-like protein
MLIITCPRCGNKKSWRVRRNKQKCAACKYEWRPQKLPLQINREQWAFLIRQLIGGKTVNTTVNQSKLSRGQVLRAFHLIRTALSMDTPEDLSAVSTELGEPTLIYVGHFKNNELYRRYQVSSKRSIASLLEPCLLLYRTTRVHGIVLIEEVGKYFKRLIKKSMGNNMSWSLLMNSNTGQLTNSRFYYIAPKREKNGDVFRACHEIIIRLRKVIAAKHGIRKKQLPLYLAEIIWKFNFRDLSAYSKRKRILSLLQEMQTTKLNEKHQL